MLGDVVWAETGFNAYSDPPNPDRYLRGCVDRCGELPEPECYECNPGSYGEKAVSFSTAGAVCGAGVCDGIGNCGACVPGAISCRDPYVQQRCNSGGDWQDEANCAFGCDPSLGVCACYLDAPADAALSCETARNMGTLVSGGTRSQFEVTGRIAAPTRSHWYRVDIPPGPRTAAGFSIELDPARSASTFRMEIHRGCGGGNYACDLRNPGSSTSTAITRWEFNDNCGADCDDADRIDLVPDASVPRVAYVRVYRVDNQVSCVSYTLVFRRP
jgi:hypothetical protein